MEEQIYFGEKIYYYELKLSQIRDLHYKIKFKEYKIFRENNKIIHNKRKIITYILSYNLILAINLSEGKDL